MSKATRRFIVNKILEMLITLVVVTLISFLLVRLSPIDPAEAYARRSFAAFSFTDEQMEALREDMGLNDPLPVQYVTWVRDALHLDFGESFVSGQPVFEKVTTAIGITVTIVLISAVTGCQRAGCSTLCWPDPSRQSIYRSFCTPASGFPA